MKFISQDKLVFRRQFPHVAAVILNVGLHLYSRRRLRSTIVSVSIVKSDAARVPLCHHGNEFRPCLMILRI